MYVPEDSQGLGKIALSAIFPKKLCVPVASVRGLSVSLETLNPEPLNL
jgi:hypothetical protein